jgi:hypothetical protein
MRLPQQVRSAIHPRLHKVFPMPSRPCFERAEQGLEQALEALPLTPPQGVEPELRAEYAAVALYIVQTKERLQLLARTWAAKGYATASPPQEPPLSSDKKKARRTGTA